ncbi:hypothetical protein Emed_005618 [Eimeria media]
MTESELVDSALPLAVSICLAFLCALGSAIFSGLTLAAAAAAAAAGGVGFVCVRREMRSTGWLGFWCLRW